MAPSLRARVDRVVVTPDGLALVVDGSIEVGFGGPTDALAKAQALRAILDYAAREDRSLLSVDVSVPGAPTATFVGSQASASVPDPSAARETERSDGGRDRGNAEGGEGSEDRASGSDDTSA
jgi:hypothetical protein